MDPILRNIAFFVLTLTLCIEVKGQCVLPLHNIPAKDLAAFDKLKPLMGKTYWTDDPKHEYRYFVGICTDAMPANEGADSKEGVVQVKKDGGDKKVIGEYTNTGIMSGTNWVYLEYGGGDTYKTHCNNEKRKAVILIVCDPMASDDSPGLRMLEEEVDKDSDCYYLFELAHPEVCEIKKSSSLSVGTIIIIVFFCVALVYLLVGLLYQRFVLGAKGIEQLPNYEFWKDFGNLQADGCNFVCRSADSRNSSPFKGLGDDQLEEAEARDDNLLPM